jgi:hypothetical protein
MLHFLFKETLKSLHIKISSWCEVITLKKCLIEHGKKVEKSKVQKSCHLFKILSNNSIIMTLFLFLDVSILKEELSTKLLKHIWPIYTQMRLSFWILILKEFFVNSTSFNLNIAFSYPSVVFMYLFCRADETGRFLFGHCTSTNVWKNSYSQCWYGKCFIST